MKTTTLIFTVFSEQNDYLSNPHSPNRKKYIIERSTEFVEAVQELTQCTRTDAIDITKVVAEELEFHLNNVRKSNDQILDLLWREINKLPCTEETSQVLIDFLNVIDRMNVNR